MRDDGFARVVTIGVPADLMRYVVEKGSIAIDGVSLTVNDVRDAEDGSTHFSVNIIPHTAKETTLHDIAIGRQLNVEVDVLARYIDRMFVARTH
jgi:riboflavin synthase